MAAAIRLTLAPRQAARVAAALWLGCGALVAFAVPLLPGDADPLAVFLIGISAIGVGTVVWFLPWNRWGERSTLALVPVAFGVIAGLNAVLRDPWAYDIFFLVSFAWVGLAHRPGTSTRAAPLFVVAYVVPLLGTDHDGHGVASLAYVLPSALLLGEAVSWVADRLQRAELATARSEARFEALVRHAGEFAVVLDDAGRVLFASSAIGRVLGVSPEETTGTDAGALVHVEDLQVVAQWFNDARKGEVLDRPLLYRARHADGSWRWIEGMVTDLRDDPSVGGIVVNGRDVTERVDAEQRLAHVARHDPLTGLPNRAALLDELTRALGRAARRGGRVAVLFLDLDGFKVVNDSLGHAVGDQVLVAVVARVRSAVRVGDLVARLGGDELTVVVEGVQDVGEPAALAERIVGALRPAIEIAGRRLVVSASIGIAVGDGEPGDLLRQADLAMYRAKELGKGRYEVFDHGLARRARRRLDTEAELRIALDKRELVVHYHPEVDIVDDVVVGMEALVRWDHPTRGLLPPSEFIDVAEESELILPLGAYVLEMACESAARWARALGPAAPRVSVNVSPRQLRDAGVVASVAGAMTRHGIEPARLRLEVTESVLVEPLAPSVLAALRDLGVSLAIDDFGTGYSSLSYLDRLPVDVVKIDRTFLAPVVAGDDRAPVVEATVAMARSLGLQVVAEGVETPGQVAMLLRVGCRYAQGYLFGPPAPQAEADRYLAASARRGAGLPR